MKILVGKNDCVVRYAFANKDEITEEVNFNGKRVIKTPDCIIDDLDFFKVELIEDVTLPKGFEVGKWRYKGGEFSKLV